ncbi:MAG: hypothetical protein IID44_08735 [Planctomycetes bacterium]|nr:hypothetical protein [Planctomycetota bacterium]
MRRVIFSDADTHCGWAKEWTLNSCCGDLTSADGAATDSAGGLSATPPEISDDTLGDGIGASTMTASAVG